MDPLGARGEGLGVRKAHKSKALYRDTPLFLEFWGPQMVPKDTFDF